MSAPAEASKAQVKPTEVEPKAPKGSSCKLGWLAYIAHPNLKKYACWWHQGSQVCRPKAKAQSKAQEASVAPAPKGAQASTKASV